MKARQDGTRKCLGLFPMGELAVEVWVDPAGRGGAFCTDGKPWATGIRAAGPPVVEVGLSYQDFDDVVAVLLHESFELYCCIHGLRYDHAPNYGLGQDSYLFILKHPDLTECMGCVAMLVTHSLRDIQREHKALMGQKK
jgi:hypothetical protein